MDEHLAREDRPTRIGRNTEERDYYSTVSDALPVFCVSSTAYQDFLDPLHCQPEGFEDPEATQIPQLRRHAITLTVTGRIRHCKQFLNKLIELLNSMRLWESAEISQRALGRAQRDDWQHVKQTSLEILIRVGLCLQPVST